MRNRRPGGFIEHEVSEHTFQGLDADSKLIVQRYSIPLPAEKGRRRFKMTRQWFHLAFPKNKDHD